MKKELLKLKRITIGLMLTSLSLFSSCGDEDLAIEFEVSKNIELISQTIPLVEVAPPTIDFEFNIDIASSFAKYDDEDDFNIEDPKINFLQYEVKNISDNITSFTLDITLLDGVVPLGTFQVTQSSTGKTTISELDLSTINANLTIAPIKFTTTIVVSNVDLVDETITNSSFDFLLYSDITITSINRL